MPWIQDISSFGPGDYRTGRFSKVRGAAHFFYGNRFFLKAGAYLVTVFISRPRASVPANLLVEALRWADEPPQIVARSEFSASNTSISLIVPLAIDLKESGPIEVRGWSDAEADSIHFDGLTVQSLRLEQLGERNSQFFRDFVSPSAEMKVALLAKQLVYSGPKRPDSFYLSRSTADAVDHLVGEIIVSGAQLPIAATDRFLFACAIPVSFLEGAVELRASVDGQASLLWRADQDADLGNHGLESAEIPEKATPPQTEDLIRGSADPSLAPDIWAGLRDRVNATVQQLFDERWRALQAQVAASAPVLPPDARAALSDRMNEIVQGLFDERWRALEAKIDSALAEIAGFKQQIPRLLNAVSAANAAATVVGKGIKNLPNTGAAAVDVASEIQELKRELQMLRTALHSVLTSDPRLPH